jgi:hypothetical protein
MANHDLPEWQRDMMRAVDDKTIRAIVKDHCRSAPAAPPAKVFVQGAGPVAGPIPSKNGWVDAPSIKNWKAPGSDIIDRLVDVQDAIDRAARARELAEVARSLAKAEK